MRELGRGDVLRPPIVPEEECELESGPLEPLDRPKPPQLHPKVNSQTAAHFCFEETTAARSKSTGWSEMHAQLEQEGVRAHPGWAENHYRWIVWKLASRRTSSHVHPLFTPAVVLQQLRQRHERESQKQYAVLRKVLERWPGVNEAAHMVVWHRVDTLLLVVVGGTRAGDRHRDAGWEACACVAMCKIATSFLRN